MSSFIRFSLVLLLLAGPALADEQRIITVTGTGVATVAPDLAHVRMSVVERNASLAAAQEAAGAVTARALTLTDRLGIAREQVNTTGASARPDYRWNRETEQQELIGYVAERMIEVELRDLDRLGELIEGAVKAGVNQVQPPELDSTKRRDTYRAALALAAEDARANAAALATALDARLGAVVSLNAANGGNPPPQPMLRMQADMAMAENAAQSYSAGDIRFEATLHAVFELQ
ncbi:MAG: SIMPL domain-containing protein [Gammaproteobacteria bacterium]|jgi:uncharacterized protein YggE